MLFAGFHKISISPPVGEPLTGFAAREGVSRGIHDDLYARALVLADEHTALAIVSVEVLALASDFVERVRAAISSRTGVAPEAVLIACTHTHAGPVTIRTFFNPDETLDPDYMDRLAAAIVDAVDTAWRGRFPAQAGLGAGRARNIGVNRRGPDGQPVDEEAALLKVADEAGRIRAVAVNFACHPTVLGPDNLLVTGDFPAEALAHIERELGAGGFAMFLNGAQGDVSMGHSSELSAIGVIAPGRTFEHAAELGQQLAEASLAALPSVPTSAKFALAAATIEVQLPLKRYPPPEAAEAALRAAEERLARLERARAPEDAIREAKSARLYAAIDETNARDTAPFTNGRMPIRLQALRLGDAALLAVPAEVFVEIGLRLKRSAPRRTLLVGLANGYIGYLPTRQAFEADGYEVVSARCGPDAEDVLVEAALALERELFAR